MENFEQDEEAEDLQPREEERNGETPDEGNDQKYEEEMPRQKL